MGQFGDENKRASDDSDPTQKQAGEREGIPTTVVKATETPPNPPATDNPQTRGERYFYLGTQAALVVITGIGIAIAICTLKSLNKSVNAANKQAAAAATQATIAREQFEATQRAWIGVDSVEVKNVARIPQSSYSFSIFVNGRNFGHAPATNIKVAWDLAATPDDLAKKAKTICHGRQFGTLKTDVTLFPDQIFPFILGAASPIPETLAQPTWLIGCFIYGDAFRKCDTIENCRYTRFCYGQTRASTGLPKYSMRYQYNDAK